MFEEPDNKVYNSEPDVIRKLKTRVVRLIIIGFSIPYILLSINMLLFGNPESRKIFLLVFPATFIFLAGLILIILRRQFKRYRPITVTLTRDSVIMDGPVFTMEFQYAHISAVRAKPNEDMPKKITIITPYSKGYLHSVQNMAGLYRELDRRIQARQTDGASESETKARDLQKKIKTIRLVLNGILLLPSLFAVYRLIQLNQHLDSDHFRMVVKIVAYLIMFIYASMNMVFSLYIRRIFNKNKNQLISAIVTILIYIGAIAFILIRTGPILGKLLFFTA